MALSGEDLQDGFGYHLLQLARRWRRFDEQEMTRHGYTDVSWVPLLHLYGAGAIKQKELALRCGVDTSSLVRLLTPLGAKGLLSRRHHPDDRRAWLLELTPQGQQEAERIAGIVARAETAMLEGLADELVNALKQSAAVINRNLERLEADEAR